MKYEFPLKYESIEDKELFDMLTTLWGDLITACHYKHIGHKEMDEHWRTRAAAMSDRIYDKYKRQPTSPPESG